MRAATPGLFPSLSDAAGGDGLDDRLTAAFLASLGERRLRPVVAVIAAYNEEKGIGGVLASMPTVVCGLEVDTVVMVDGASDGTADAARAAGAALAGTGGGAVGPAGGGGSDAGGGRSRVLVCEAPVNRGQGAALRLGYRLAREGGASYIATLDGDGQYDPAQLAAVIEPLVAGRADFVTGSRRLGAAHTTDRFRALGVVVFGALISVLIRQRITDPTNGLRAMRATVTGAVELAQPQYQATELLIGVAMRGFRVVEVPVTMYSRSAGRTKKGGNVSYGWRVGRVILGTWWRERGRRPR